MVVRYRSLVRWRFDEADRYQIGGSGASMDGPATRLHVYLNISSARVRDQHSCMFTSASRRG